MKKKCRHDRLRKMADGSLVRCENCNKTWIQIGHDKDLLTSINYKVGGG